MIPPLRSLVLAVLVSASVGMAAEPLTGPETEKRFPPLTLPDGFRATLFACDPLLEYPSVIALGPRAGTLFSAHDYVTGLGIDIVRRDEIRLLEDTNGDGYADKSTVYAEGFNSIQGLAYHRGMVFAMHAPLLTALRDIDGDGKADERTDLLNGLGLTPEKNTTRLHCANGVVVGHDGWLYLAMGDNGTDVMRPEGDRLSMQAGGILRCRPNGRQLHVFATGLRNIYDIALDEELNVFVRDNENDGGDYMIRVCHSFHGADHGYPYLYYERPLEAMPPLADLGRGSSAGGMCYLETMFPVEYRGNLFFCEWGRSVVRYERDRKGSSFAPMKEHEFAAAAPNDPYGLKPTDVLVDRDGSLLVSDWGDGQRPKRGRGRIYRISYGEPAALTPVANEVAGLVAQLDAPGLSMRVEAQEALLEKRRDELEPVWQAFRKKSIGPLGRMHAVWIFARADGTDALRDLVDIAHSDPDAHVRAQAVRAIADVTDPTLSEERPGARGIAEVLSKLPVDQDPRLLLQVILALGRMKWHDSPAWLREHLRQPDAALDHAAQQTLRRANNWPPVLELLDDPALRPIALRALTDQFEPAIVNGLIARLAAEKNPERRIDYASVLAYVYKRPGEWVYWGYRPAPRPANTMAWEKTEAIGRALDGLLADPDHAVRTAVLRRMQREQIPVSMDSLRKWVEVDRRTEHVQAILDSVSKLPADEVRDLLASLVSSRDHALENRQAALAQMIAGLNDATEPRLVALTTELDDGPVLAQVLRELGRRPKLDARALLVKKLDSAAPEVRAAALGTCALRRIEEAVPRVPPLLADADPAVREAAVRAAGVLKVRESVAALVRLSADPQAGVRSASLRALRLLKEPRVLPEATRALEDPETQLAALEYLTDFGGPDQLDAVAGVAAGNRSVESLAVCVQALAAWDARETSPTRKEALARAVATVHGESGVLLSWRAGMVTENIVDTVLLNPPPGAKAVLAIGSESRVDLDGPTREPAQAVWMAAADLLSAEAGKAQFLASSTTPLEIRINGRTVFTRAKAGAFQPDADRFEAELTAGLNRVVLRLQGPKTQFHVRFRRLSSSAEHERLVQYALQNTGNAERGRELFQNAEKSLCVKCHRLGDQGGNVGPILTGVGDRFSRIHLIESILEPSRTIAPSYETLAVALTSGKTQTGVKIAEDDATLSLGDEHGKRHDIPKSEIEDRVTGRVSTMPVGLEKRLTDREFLDLLTFLVSQKR